MRTTHLYPFYQALRTIEDQTERCMESLTEGAVHDLRVAIRRIVPYLRLFEDCTSGTQQKTLQLIRAYYRSVFKQLSPLRDAQVSEILLTERHLLQDYSRQLRAMQTKEKVRVLQELETFNPRDVSDRLINLVSNAPISETTLISAVDRMIRRRAKRVLRHRDRETTDLHKLRIDVKKHRYALELTEHLAFTSEKKSKTFKHDQDLLGLHHDLDVLLALLSSADLHRIEAEKDTLAADIQAGLPDLFSRVKKTRSLKKLS